MDNFGSFTISGAISVFPFSRCWQFSQTLQQTPSVLFQGSLHVILRYVPVNWVNAIRAMRTSLCKQLYSKSYERIVMKFHGGVQDGNKNWLNIGSDLGLLRWAKKMITIIACPDWSAGNDPDALGLAFHHQGLTFINAYCQTAINLFNQDWV